MKNEDTTPINTTVVTKWQGAMSLVFGNGRAVRGTGGAVANQPKAEDALDYASRATILPLNPSRMDALLQKSGLVQYQDRICAA